MAHADAEPFDPPQRFAHAERIDRPADGSEVAFGIDVERAGLHHRYRMRAQDALERLDLGAFVGDAGVRQQVQRDP